MNIIDELPNKNEYTLETIPIIKKNIYIETIPLHENGSMIVLVACIAIGGGVLEKYIIDEKPSFVS